jgi:hypothetical protein
VVLKRKKTRFPRKKNATKKTVASTDPIAILLLMLLQQNTLSIQKDMEKEYIKAAQCASLKN